ncbi:hypothetical protein SAMN05216184_104131 [Georgenia satyanarayanai]|uniref:Uncharacterized protein n=1 Tax=Georgenia satyanarayanai TaxID=860221 RepID=A0A2Y9C4Z2_9MICO|nr:hypothetical protein [Georgenia satyanarayanai]PYG00192.1 hypothetical protein A8987_104131 [Georgenia satyanarayanai]SSA40433.1 hypothetical protein SAMN05216184_104131 [Georgenia satyanarayanai]
MTATDPAVTAHHNNVAAFVSQLDRRPRTYVAPEPEDREIEPCYCDHPLDDHTGPDTECQHCDCAGFAEHTEVRLTLDTLDADDQLNEGRRRNNLPSAIRLARQRARTRGMFPRAVR